MNFSHDDKRPRIGVSAAEVSGANAKALRAPRAPLTEVFALKDLAKLPAFAPTLLRSKLTQQKGRRVVVLPGFQTGDKSTLLIRETLRAAGFRASGWGIGTNHGDAELLLGQMLTTLEPLFHEEESIDLVGWSLGGYIAREIARERPDKIARVVTLASPIIGGPKYTAAARYFKGKGLDLDDIERRVAKREEDNPLTVPVYALYTKRDGVVDWRACLDHDSPHTKHLKMNSTHWSVGISKPTLNMVVQCLKDTR